MNEQRLIEIQKEIQAIGIQKILHNADASEQFTRLYKEVYPSEDLCGTCPGRLNEAVQLILNISQSKIRTMSQTSKYKVANNGIIDTVYSPIEGVPLHITNDNITDEIANKLIEANPNFKHQLVEMSSGQPAELVDGNSPEKKSDDPKTNEEKIAELVDGNSRQQLIDMLNELKIEFNPSSNKSELAAVIVAAFEDNK